MRKSLLQWLFAIVMVLTSTVVYGQSSSTVRGKVVDSESGEGVYGATVLVVIATNQGATELDGTFRITGLSGDVTLRISSSDLLLKM